MKQQPRPRKFNNGEREDYLDMEEASKQSELSTKSLRWYMAREDEKRLPFRKFIVYSEKGGTWHPSLFIKKSEFLKWLGRV